MLFPLHQYMVSFVAGGVTFKSWHRIHETFPKDISLEIWLNTIVQHTFGKWFGELAK